MDSCLDLFIEGSPVFESIVVIEITRSAKAKRHIAESVSRNVCCNCGGGAIWKNGICRKCHYKIGKLVLELPRDKRGPFRSRLLRSGRMLQPQEIRKWKYRDVLDQIAEEMS